MLKVWKQAKKNNIHLDEVYKPVSKDLTGVESVLAGILSNPDAVDSGLNFLKAGGKRIRPALVLLSSLFGAGPCPVVARLAVAVEVLHLASLVHDDIIDCSESRRGESTISQIKGKNTAILAGDYLYALFLEQAAGLGEYPLSSLAGALKDMVQAEIAQQQALFNCDTSEKDYFKRISGKSGSFLSCCCKLGAWLAGAPGEITHSLERFGWLFGISFQIKDDLLDFAGETTNMGKPVAQDLRQGVLTLPVIHALRHSPGKKELRALIENREITASSLDFITGELLASGSLAYTKRVADRYVWLAGRILAVLPRNSAWDSLSALLEFSTLRER